MPRHARLAVLATAALAASAAPASARPVAGAPGCPVLPAASPWNQRIDRLPRAVGSSELVRMLKVAFLHAGWDHTGGIPVNVATSSTPRVRYRFDSAASDDVAYPMPASPKIEADTDRHLLVVDRDACKLYETYDARQESGGWHAYAGAVFDLRSTRLRPDGLTSADAAGLPILPGLARFEELGAGGFDHALRVTMSRTQAAWVWPARHQASYATDPSLPPMGLRIRLRASFPIGRFPAQARAVLVALKRYGLIVADNGTSGAITGAPDPRWNVNAIHALDRVPGSALEVVDVSSLRGAARARVWNSKASVAGGSAVVRAFLTRRATVRAVALVGGRVVAHGPSRRVGEGLVHLRVVARAGASYRIVIVRR